MLSKLDQKRHSSCNIIIKTPNTQNKEGILNVVREKGKVTYKGTSVRITQDFSTKTKNQKIFGRFQTDPKRT